MSRKTDVSALWQRVGELCDLRGYTHKGLSEQCGCPANAITLWRSRKRWPDVPTLLCMAQSLHVSVEYIVTGKEPKKGDLSGPVADVVDALRAMRPEQIETFRVAANAVAKSNKPDQ